MFSQLDRFSRPQHKKTLLPFAQASPVGSKQCVCKMCFFWLSQLDAFVDHHWTLSQLRRWFMLLLHRGSISLLQLSVLASAPKRVTDKLQSVLNAAARLITVTQKY